MLTINDEVINKHINYLKKINRDGSYNCGTAFFKCISKKSYSELELKEKSKDFIIEFFKENFDHIIRSTIDRLIETEQFFYNKLSEYENKKVTDVKLIIDKTLENNLGYKNFSNTKGKWNALEFCKYLKVNTCPYCNLQFTYSIDRSIKSIRPHLDHFYPKSKHPLLSMSLYNLIPSCYTCNSSLKRDVEPVKILDWYPYNKDIYSQFYIERKFDSTQDFYSALLGYSEEYILRFYAKDEEFKESLNDFLELFFLKERYNMHKSGLNKELIKFFSYSPSYIKSLDKAYDINITYEQLISNFTANNNDEDVLSKLINDIILDEQNYIY